MTLRILETYLTPPHPITYIYKLRLIWRTTVGWIADDTGLMPLLSVAGRSMSNDQIEWRCSREFAESLLGGDMEAAWKAEECVREFLIDRSEAAVVSGKFFPGHAYEMRREDVVDMFIDRKFRRNLKQFYEKLAEGRCDDIRNYVWAAFGNFCRDVARADPSGRHHPLDELHDNTDHSAENPLERLVAMEQGQENQRQLERFANERWKNSSHLAALLLSVRVDLAKRELSEFNKEMWRHRFREVEEIFPWNEEQSALRLPPDALKTIFGVWSEFKNCVITSEEAGICNRNLLAELLRVKRDALDKWVQRGRDHLEREGLMV